MGLFDFVKDAGEKIFGGKGGRAAPPPGRDLDDVLADKQKGETLTRVVTDLGLKVEGFRVKFRDGKATLMGKAASQADKEKIVLMVGNTHGVGQVDDQLQVEKPEAEAKLYTVKSGDSLSKIAKAHYGDAMKYMTIFEANRPMLKDPDKIYPGQVLRIPPVDK